uniref:NADH dehydrogenase subunit 6 n=1 Tax=Ossuaria sichuanensis TaxID=3060451 RepID=UPI00286CC1A4|nr:NADH dehydrogenase subunit 6 [Ossuaria sichuanensis]WKW96227.1 NADH dehydrogenase subunit 6 [Ossuaria sichuanensis]
MKLMIMKLMLVTSSLTPFLKNPMSMGFALMLMTMFLIMFLNLMMTSSWFMMITFLMMIGGLLIIFSYMSSMASNEKFNFKINLIMIMTILLIMIDEMNFDYQINENEQIFKTSDKQLALIKIFNLKSMSMTLMLVLYLFITMVSVTKIVKHHKGPLRSYNKYE